MPKISVIMPIYNGVRFLRDAMDSILNQTYSDFEVLVVNEYGSDDGSAEIIMEYASVDKRVRLIQNKKKLGVSASLNVGIRAAQGEYIARMDGDDISLPERFEKQVKYLDLHPACGMVGCKVEQFGENIFVWELETNSDLLHTNTLFFSPCVHPTVMIRASILHKHDIFYNPEFFASEDYDFFVRLNRFTGISNIDEVLFRYRIWPGNATFKNNDAGLSLYLSVMEEQFKCLGLEFTEQELRLLCVHYSLKGMNGDDALRAFINLDLLLKRIFGANEKKKLYNKKILFKTLCKRYKEAFENLTWQCKNYTKEKAEEFFRHSVFSYLNFYSPPRSIEENMPLISIVIPTFNSEKYILECLWSLLIQTYTNCECLIINEYGSNDDTLLFADIFEDKRIRVIQNDTKLGLADSLNKGFKEARGEFIARADSDDSYPPERLEKQYQFLMANTDIVICGTWQRHWGLHTNRIHKPPVTHEELKAQMIYTCEMCHSTLMIRKALWFRHKFLYNKSSIAEDYELWTRAVYEVGFANIPEVLGYYRVGEENITRKKWQKLTDEAGRISADILLKYLRIYIPKQYVKYLGMWTNLFNEETDKVKKNKLMETEKKMLRSMWINNKIFKVYDQNCLLKTINRRWYWITNTIFYDRFYESDLNILPIDELFSVKPRRRYSMKIKEILKKTIKDILKPLYNKLKIRFERIVDERLYKVYRRIDELSNWVDDINRWLGETSEWVGSVSKRIDETSGWLGETSEWVKSLDKRVDETGNKVSKFNIRLAKNQVVNDRFIIDYSREIKDKLLSQSWENSIDTSIVPTIPQYQPFRYNKKVAEYIAALPEFFFCPNNGNLGDTVIAEAEYQFLKNINSNYSIFDIYSEEISDKKHFNFVYGGGGIFVKYYNYQEILNIFKFPNLRRCIILSASFFECDDLIEVLDGRFLVFCRERRSYEYCIGRNKKAEFILSDDMAFNLDINSTMMHNSGHITGNMLKLKDKYLNIVYANYSNYMFTRTKILENLSEKTIILNDNVRIGFLLRNVSDTESKIQQSISNNIDLSAYTWTSCSDPGVVKLLSMLFIKAINTLDVVITDRAHVCIISAMLGKEVYTLDNSYGKVFGIIEQSMKNFDNVQCIERFDDYLVEKIKTKKTKADLSLFESDMTFLNYLTEWMSVYKMNDILKDSILSYEGGIV
jgi:glycosyltransferase involved in cell wall biosynthesis/exopolysaccharide biosynthesis predicted pyruvyltransferase EpsI